MKCRSKLKNRIKTFKVEREIRVERESESERTFWFKFNSLLLRMRSDNHRLRVGLDRNYSQQQYHHHHKPYNRPSYQSNNPGIPVPSTPGNIDDRWNHDLFQPDSSLYGPKINQTVLRQQLPTSNISFGNIFAPPKPSPSLRPFGTSTFTSSSASDGHHPIVSRSSGIFAASSSPRSSSSSPNNLRSNQKVLSKPSQTTINSNNPVRNIISSKPSSSSDTQNTTLNPTSSLLSRIQSVPSLQNRSIQQSSSTNRPVLQSNNTSKSVIKQIPEPKSILNPSGQRAYEEAMNQYLSGPVILEVANLADGTSAEDVQTAFADFGEIQDCSTEEGPRQGNQQTLRARMVFVHKAEAERAVDALNGALADGLTLAVKIVGRPNKKPEKSDFTRLPLPASSVSVTKEADGDVLMGDISEQTNHAPVIPTGKLRSDLVAQVDPRATLQSEPTLQSIYKQPSNILNNKYQTQSSENQRVLQRSQQSLNRTKEDRLNNVNRIFSGNTQIGTGIKVEGGSGLSLLARINKR
ncbi:hypothetical protein PPACK8108_LOCUS23685 [Phakopsora pachyrhizi]|uniref:RRM domain-containing protein n=1 Tax=Phakopsora pachyrhizi TaxID=170000 RepID=A0AAV0BPW6_PHAPC|nr:hypothetical protein PPACK8108_LOCUS23685 [Phakopsora pachyrhizi]